MALYFNSITLAPKKKNDVSWCARWCHTCKDNVSEIRLNLDINNPFYPQLHNFLNQNQPLFNKEINFFYYGDFISNFDSVSTGIEHLYFHKILLKHHNIWVWSRSEAIFRKRHIDFIKGWDNEWKLTVKFSFDLSVNFASLISKIKNLNKMFTIISYSQLWKDTIEYQVHAHNIELMNLTIKEKENLFYFIKFLKKKFPAVIFNFSTQEVLSDFSRDFTPDTFSYPHLDFSKCHYLNPQKVEISLESNFLSPTDIYMENVDIFEDSIAIHDPNCKKVKQNHFWTIADSIETINTNIRKFVARQRLLEKTQTENICHDCKMAVN